MLKECFEKSKQILSENRKTIEKLVDYLIKNKEINEEEFMKIVKN